MKLVTFNIEDFLNTPSLLDPYLNKNYYFLLICWSNSYRCCCRQYWYDLEVHDDLNIDYIKELWKSTKNELREIDYFEIYLDFSVEKYMYDLDQKCIGKAELKYKPKNNYFSIWKGHFKNETFELIYQN